MTAIKAPRTPPAKSTAYQPVIQNVGANQQLTLKSAVSVSSGRGKMLLVR